MDVQAVAVHVLDQRSAWPRFVLIFVLFVPYLTFCPLAVGHSNITCSSVEYVTLNPPSGATCGSYMQKYISVVGGYLENSGATSDCNFCSTRTTDEFLVRNFNIEYSSHWWHLGVFCAYILFNVSGGRSVRGDVDVALIRVLA